MRGISVSTSTTIQGGWIATNTITAEKIALGDFTNYCTVNPGYPATMLPTNIFGGTKVSGTADTGSMVIRKVTESQQYLMFCNYTPFCFNAGDEIYFYGNIPNYSSTNCSAAIRIWFNGIKVSGQWNVAGAAYTSKTFTAASSDIRLKTNICPTEVEVLPLLNQIGIYQFDWKRDGVHQKIGFIADYLEQQDSNLSIGGGYDEHGMMDEKVVNDFYQTAK